MVASGSAFAALPPGVVRVDSGPASALVRTPDGTLYAILVIQSAPGGYGFGFLDCPSSPPELSGILHVPASAFVPLSPPHRRAAGR